MTFKQVDSQDYFGVHEIGKGVLTFPIYCAVLVLQYKARPRACAHMNEAKREPDGSNEGPSKCLQSLLDL